MLSTVLASFSNLSLSSSFFWRLFRKLTTFLSSSIWPSESPSGTTLTSGLVSAGVQSRAVKWVKTSLRFSHRSPSSPSASSVFFPELDLLKQGQKITVPSLAKRVSIREISMLTTSRTRQMQKCVPAAQTRQLAGAAVGTGTVSAEWWLTDDGAALAVSWQHVVEDDEEHGEAEHQCHLEGVALATGQRQGEADHVGQDDQDAGQHQRYEGVEIFDAQVYLQGRNIGSVSVFCCPQNVCVSCCSGVATVSRKHT